MDSVDRISDLPPNITEHILRCLPLEDAVRTSILSTHWRYKWTLLLQLVLNRGFFRSVQKLKKYFKGVFDLLYTDETLKDGMLEYSNIVNNILLRHDGPIHKFVLHIPSWFQKDADFIHWIHFVSGKLVKDLTLSDGNRQLPSQMFSCVEFNHLTHLTLIQLFLPPILTTFMGFPCLVSLNLQFAKSVGEANKVGILVSKCPLLEILDLVIFEDESCLTIRAPKLQNLVVHGCLSGIFLEETERIKMLSLSAALDHKRDLMKELFSCLPLVEKLSLGFFFCRDCLGEVGQPLGKLDLTKKLRELKSLKFNGVRLPSQSAITYMLCLFQMAPKLQFLEIAVLSVSQADPSSSTVEGDCRLGHLKTVKISTTNYSVTSQLIHMLLSSSPVLEKMTIEANVQAEEKFDIAKELSQYPRASANAEIIIKR